MVVELMILPAKGKTIKGSEQPDTQRGENDEERKGHAHIQNNFDFQRNPLKFKREGSRVKNLDGLQKFINFAPEFIM
jgi:hypothetical protein